MQKRERARRRSLKRGFLVVVSGPSAAGKNSLLNAVVPTVPTAQYSVSATTRPPRPGEIDGEDYFFLTDEQFDSKIASGELLEWATFVGYRYGTPKDFVEDCLARGEIVLMDIDIQGASQVRERMPDAILVFVLPPSFKVLRERIEARGKDSEAAIARRMAEVGHELSHLAEYDYVVFNDDLEEAAAELRAIIRAEQCRMTRYDASGLKESFLNNREPGGGGHRESTVFGPRPAEGR